MVDIPAGEFTRGTDAGDWEERPAQIIRFRAPFRMGKTEITVRQFRVFVDATAYVTDAERQGWAWDSNFRPRQWSQKKPGLSWKNTGFGQTGEHPVTAVSWNDAAAFCRWLSKEAGRRIRLPSEAEWEYACRSGAGQGKELRCADIAWFVANSEFQTHPVATQKPNDFGLYDMLGNVSEWVEDLWHRNYVGAPCDGSSWLTGNTSERVTRGGSYEREAGEFSPSGRDWYEPGEAIVSQGFRIVEWGSL
jgi:formylglycine-generating enzyme required for sulfatase activity